MAHRTYQGIVLLAAIFLLIISCTPKGKTMRAYRLPDGQYRIEEDGKPVLQYNYQTVYEKDVIRFNDELREKPVEGEVSGSYRDEYISQHPGVPKDTLVTTNIYAVPRSDYIHPLFGLQGETLTRDWPIDGEPHHRGIWWAWPEVRYGSLQGDLYALQRIFARPTGKVDLVSSPDYHIKVDGPIELSVLAMKLGRSIQFDPVREMIIGDPEATRLSIPEYRDPWKFPWEYL